MRSKKAIPLANIVSIFMIACVTIAIATIVSYDVVKRLQHQNATRAAAVCPDIYENDLFQFEYSCDSGVLPTDNGRDVEIITYTHRGSYKEYLLVDTPSAGVGDRFTECEDGERFSRQKMNIPSLGGEQHEACLHADEGGQTLTIRSDRSETGYVSIGAEGGLISEIIPSLMMK